MKKRGFSLVEAIVSITILLVGVLALVSLGIAMVSQARLTNAQVAASQLAREGVEVIRALRDGNWLEAEDVGGGIPWNNGLSSGTDYSAVLEWDVSSNIWTVDFDAVNFGNCVTGFDCTRLYTNTAAPFESAQFASAPPAAWEEIAYQRLVRLFPICRSATDETLETVLTADGATCSGSEEQVGIDVQVEVRWEEKGISRSTTVEEYIYDWKY